MLFEGKTILYLNNELFLCETEVNSSFIEFTMDEIEPNSSVLRFLNDWEKRKCPLESIYILTDDETLQLCYINKLQHTYWRPNCGNFEKCLTFRITYNTFNKLK